MTQPIVMITGASSGIGLATAELLAQENYELILLARRTEPMSQAYGKKNTARKCMFFRWT